MYGSRLRRGALAALILVFVWAAGAAPAGAESGSRSINIHDAKPLEEPSQGNAAPVPPQIVVQKAGPTVVAAGQSQPLTATWLVREGRLLVPARSVAAAAGADVKVDPDRAMATIALGNTLIELTAGSPDALVDGWNPAALDPTNPKVTPVMAGDELLAPLGFLAAALGLTVVWQVSETEVGPAPEPPAPIRDVAAPGAEPGGEPAEPEAEPVSADQTGTAWFWFRVQGTVTDAAGLPVSGADVIASTAARPRYPLFLQPASLADQFRTSTDENGVYRLDLPYGDSYDITSFKPCYTEGAATIGGGWVTDLMISPVTAAAAHITPASTRNYTFKGVVVDQNNKRVPGACVAVTGEGKRGRVSLRANDKGEFELDWPIWGALKAEIFAQGCVAGIHRISFEQAGGEGGPRIVVGHPSDQPYDPKLAQYNRLTAEQQTVLGYFDPNKGASLASNLAVWCGPKPEPTPPKPPAPPPGPAPECKVNYATITVTIPDVVVWVTDAAGGTVLFAASPVQNFRVAPGVYEIQIIASYGTVTDRTVSLGPCGYYRAGGYLRP